MNIMNDIKIIIDNYVNHKNILVENIKKYNDNKSFIGVFYSHATQFCDGSIGGFSDKIDNFMLKNNIKYISEVEWEKDTIYYIRESYKYNLDNRKVAFYKTSRTVNYLFFIDDKKEFSKFKLLF